MNSHDYDKHLENLHGKSLAVVYSFSNTIDKKRTWYDRWRSDVIMYFAQGAENLGLDVRYLDVDTFLNEIVSTHDFKNDFILNLHSGLNRISSWPIISSLASWRNIPSGFCPSDVHISCERKDITRAIASPLAIKLPRQIQDAATAPSGTFVVKERDLGMSVGLRKTSDKEIMKAALQKSNLFVEEFIPGFDATIALLINANDSYTLLGARYCLPKGANPHDWMYTEEIKNLPMLNHEYSSEKIYVDSDIADELKKLSKLLGTGSVYRFDFRVKPNEKGNAPNIMTLENSWLLEATPTPMIAEDTEFGFIMKDAFNDSMLLKELVGENTDAFEGERAPQSVLVANILYKAVLNMVD